MGKIYLFTGEVGVGKTAALQKVVRALGTDRCGGISTKAIGTQEEVSGFNIVTLDRHVGLLAAVSSDSPLGIGRYGVVLHAIEGIGLTALSDALVSKQFIVIDEIGPMQLISEQFKRKVLEILESPVPLLGTIFGGSYPWTDQLKQHKDVELTTLTPENSNSVIKGLINTLKAASS